MLYLFKYLNYVNVNTFRLQKKLQETKRNLLHSSRNFASKGEMVYTRRNYSCL